MSWNQDEAEKQFRGTYGWESIPEDWVIGEPPNQMDGWMLRTQIFCQKVIVMMKSTSKISF